VHLPVGRDAEQAEAETPAEVAEPRITLSPLPSCRQACGEPNLIGKGCTVYGLQDELKTESELQLTDHQDRRVISFEPDEVAAANLALDRIPEALEERFHRGVKRGLEPLPFTGVGAIASILAMVHEPNGTCHGLRLVGQGSTGGHLPAPLYSETTE
jgi:hypothetical protein